MTQSQSIARVFMFVGYILIFPAIIATLFSLVTGYFAIITIMSFGVGTYLLFGYRKHARGDLSEGKIILLWVGTGMYNFVLLVPQIWFVFQRSSLHSINATLYEGNIAALIYFSIIMWQFMAILLSITALVNQISFNQKFCRVP